MSREGDSVASEDSGNEPVVIPASAISHQNACTAWEAAQRSLVDGLAALGAWMSEAFLPLMQQITPALQALRDAVYQRYLEAGAPYGETSEGFVRWMGEPSEAERLRARTEAIEQRVPAEYLHPAGNLNEALARSQVAAFNQAVRRRYGVRAPLREQVKQSETECPREE